MTNEPPILEWHHLCLHELHNKTFLIQGRVMVMFRTRSLYSCTIYITGLWRWGQPLPCLLRYAEMRHEIKFAFLPTHSSELSFRVWRYCLKALLTDLNNLVYRIIWINEWILTYSSIIHKSHHAVIGPRLFVNYLTLSWTCSRKA